MKRQEASPILDDIDEKTINLDIRKDINELYKNISTLFNFKYQLLIYRLVRGNYISQENLAKVSGTSRQRINQIVENFESRELARKQTDGEDN